MLKGKLNALLFEHHKVGTYALDGSTVSFSIPDDPGRLTTGRLDDGRVVLDYHTTGITWTMTLNR